VLAFGIAAGETRTSFRVRSKAHSSGSLDSSSKEGYILVGNTNDDNWRPVTSAYDSGYIGGAHTAGWQNGAVYGDINANNAGDRNRYGTMSEQAVGWLKNKGYLEDHPFARFTVEWKDDSHDHVYFIIKNVEPGQWQLDDDNYPMSFTPITATVAVETHHPELADPIADASIPCDIEVLE